MESVAPRGGGGGGGEISSNRMPRPLDWDVARMKAVGMMWGGHARQFIGPPQQAEEWTGLDSKPACKVGEGWV